MVALKTKKSKQGEHFYWRLNKVCITAANVLHSDMQRLNNASSPAAIESKTP